MRWQKKDLQRRFTALNKKVNFTVAYMREVVIVQAAV